jgi:hypothetical protein
VRPVLAGEEIAEPLVRQLVGHQAIAREFQMGAARRAASDRSASSLWCSPCRQTQNRSPAIWAYLFQG